MAENIRESVATMSNGSAAGGSASGLHGRTWFRRGTALAILLLPGAALWAGPMKRQTPGQQLAGVAMGLALVICVELGLLATCLLYAVLEPERVRAGSALQARSAFRSFGVGVLMVVILLLACGLISQMPDAISGLLAIPLLAAYTYVLIMGFTMVAHGVGDRIQSNTSSTTMGSSFFAVLYGGSILLLTNFVPFVGQLVLLIVALLAIGLGTRSVSQRRREKKAARQAAREAVNPPAEDDIPETTS